MSDLKLPLQIYLSTELGTSSWLCTFSRLGDKSLQSLPLPLEEIAILVGY